MIWAMVKLGIQLQTAQEIPWLSSMQTVPLDAMKYRTNAHLVMMNIKIT